MNETQEGPNEGPEEQMDLSKHPLDGIDELTKSVNRRTISKLVEILGAGAEMISPADILEAVILEDGQQYPIDAVRFGFALGISAEALSRIMESARIKEFPDLRENDK